LVSYEGRQVSFWCTHEWEVKVDKTEKALLLQIGRFTSENLPHSAFEGKSITILACTKCGKINKTVVTV